MSDYRTADRPDTTRWADLHDDAYGDGHTAGERAARHEDPGPDHYPRDGGAVVNDRVTDWRCLDCDHSWPRDFSDYTKKEDADGD